MDKLTVTLVAGYSGVGKTTWIQQQINQINSDSAKVLYFSPGVGNTPIDHKRLESEYPFLQAFTDGQELEFLQQLPSADAAWVEFGFCLELNTSVQLFSDIPQRRIAILPQGVSDSEYYGWADEVIRGTSVISNNTQIWRVNLTGQVIDEDSLQELWYEMTQGAYGDITRIKGIFDVADGRSLYGDFILGVPTNHFSELDVPRHLSGRPQRFSGLEVVGNNFDETALKQTLADCCLTDAMVGQYQQQVQQYLMESAQR